MSSIGQTIFGGSSSKSKSENKAYGDIKKAYSPIMEKSAEGANALSALLGGDASGLSAYKKATGFDSMAKMGSQGITGNAAAGGLLRSGSAGKALMNYGNTINNQAAGQYMQQLLGLAGLGNQAGSLLSGSGNVSTSSSSEKPGLMSTVGAMMASDPRLKMNVEKIDELEDGLAVYTYSYIWEDSEAAPAHIGVMADEVAELRPWALGPELDGFMTVDYGKL